MSSTYSVNKLYSDGQIERIPHSHEFIRGELLSEMFDVRGELVQTLANGERHAIKIGISREPESLYEIPGHRYTLYCQHEVIPTRVVVDTQLVVDRLSVGELWREFWERVNRKRRMLGVGFIVNEFLEEVERMQGWADERE